MSLFSSRRDVLRWATLAPVSRLLAWQDDAKFSTAVNVVNVLASVRDKDGKIVRNLVKEDFALEEDGHPQAIRYFSQQTDTPLTLGLLIDTSGSQQRVLSDERRASYKFLEQVLREGKDQAFVIHFDYEVELLQDLTSSRKDLEAALNDLETPRPQLNRRSPGGGGPPRQAGLRRGGTALYDAVLLASDEVMRKRQGRKALIVLSDGVDNGSKVSLSSGIESAQRSDTLAYAVRFYDTAAYGNNGGFGGPFPGGGRRRGGYGGGPRPVPSERRPDGKKVLEQIARETGGGYFEVSGKQPLDKIYSQIEDELRNQYNLGYTSDQSGSGYRKIRVTLPRMKQFTVQAREGYYARSS